VDAEQDMASTFAKCAKACWNSTKASPKERGYVSFLDQHGCKFLQGRAQQKSPDQTSPKERYVSF
jgi:hypothetical protein